MKQTKKLEVVEVPLPMAQIIKRRVRPLIHRYWQRQGTMSLEDIAFSAYTQAIHDCVRLNQTGQMPTPEPWKSESPEAAPIP